jgi:hypothetical protein
MRGDLLAVPSAYAVCAWPGQHDAGMDWNGWRRARSPAKSQTARGQPGPLVNAAFREWESYLAAGPRSVRERADLDARTDPPGLATGIMAAYRATTCSPRRARTSRPIAVAMDGPHRGAAGAQLVPTKGGGLKLFTLPDAVTARLDSPVELRQ